MHRKKTYGFTLVELLIVIVIISVLAATVIVSFGAIQKTARDSKRSADMMLFTDKLNKYFNANGVYPDYTSYSSNTAFWDDMKKNGIVDPRDNAAINIHRETTSYCNYGYFGTNISQNCGNYSYWNNRTVSVGVVEASGINDGSGCQVGRVASVPADSAAILLRYDEQTNTIKFIGDKTKVYVSYSRAPSAEISNAQTCVLNN